MDESRWDLLKEAQETCKRLGRRMYPVEWIVEPEPGDEYGKAVGTIECVFCGMQVVINTHPMPNEVDIGGKAVALHCSGYLRPEERGE